MRRGACRPSGEDSHVDSCFPASRAARRRRCGMRRLLRCGAGRRPVPEAEPADLRHRRHARLLVGRGRPHGARVPRARGVHRRAGEPVRKRGDLRRRARERRPGSRGGEAPPGSLLPRRLRPHGRPLPPGLRTDQPAPHPCLPVGASPADARGVLRRGRRAGRRRAPGLDRSHGGRDASRHGGRRPRRPVRRRPRARTRSRRRRGRGRGRPGDRGHGGASTSSRNPRRTSRSCSAARFFTASTIRQRVPRPRGSTRT